MTSIPPSKSPKQEGGPALEPTQDAGRETAKSRRAGPVKARATATSTWIATSPASAERLSLFTPKQIANVARRLTEPVAAEWPAIDGFLAILFTPRCGSTFLARELVRRYDIGSVGESFNPPRLTGRTGAEIVDKRKGAWFGTKLGLQGVIAAELTGVIDHYLERMAFIFLLRRDIVAQAVSLAKARQMQRFHSTGRETDIQLVYNPAHIGASVRAIVHTTAHFQKILHTAGRPSHRFHYEDSEDGNLGRLQSVCDSLSIPRAADRQGRNFAELKPIRDAINAEWAERFRAQMPPKARSAIEQYESFLDQ